MVFTGLVGRVVSGSWLSNNALLTAFFPNLVMWALITALVWRGDPAKVVNRGGMLATFFGSGRRTHWRERLRQYQQGRASVLANEKKLSDLRRRIAGVDANAEAAQPSARQASNRSAARRRYRVRSFLTLDQLGGVESTLEDIDSPTAKKGVSKVLSGIPARPKSSATRSPSARPSEAGHRGRSISSIPTAPPP